MQIYLIFFLEGHYFLDIQYLYIILYPVNIVSLRHRLAQLPGLPTHIYSPWFVFINIFFLFSRNVHGEEHTGTFSIAKSRNKMLTINSFFIRMDFAHGLDLTKLTRSNRRPKVFFLVLYNPSPRPPPPSTQKIIAVNRKRAVYPKSNFGIT